MNQLAELKNLERVVACESPLFIPQAGNPIDISSFMDSAIDRSRDIYEKHLKRKLSLNSKGGLVVPSGLRTHNLTLVILRVHLSYIFDEVKFIDEEGVTASIPDLACRGQRFPLAFTGIIYKQVHGKEYLQDHLDNYAIPSLPVTLIEVKSGGMNGAKEQLSAYEYFLGVSCNKLVYMLEKRRGLHLVQQP